MVVKSKVVAKHMGDLRSVFEVLIKHKLHLNASKCSFGVGLGKFLGYMVTHRGIEVNPDQIKAINDLQPPWNPKEVKKLTGMTVALNRFISLSTDRCRPFFQLLHKWKGFEWNEECALAFQQLKEYLSRPPIVPQRWPYSPLFSRQNCEWKHLLGEANHLTQRPGSSSKLEIFTQKQHPSFPCAFFVELGSLLPF